MKLYQISNEIEKALENILIDEETGEVSGFNEWETLKGDLKNKLLETSIYIKNLRNEVLAFKTEEKSLSTRRKAVENHIEFLENQVYWNMTRSDIKNIKDTKCEIMLKTSTKVETSNNFVQWAKENNSTLLRYKEPEPNKAEIKQLLKTMDIPHVRIAEEEVLKIK